MAGTHSESKAEMVRETYPLEAYVPPEWDPHYLDLPLVKLDTSKFKPFPRQKLKAYRLAPEEKILGKGNYAVGVKLACSTEKPEDCNYAAKIFNVKPIPLKHSCFSQLELVEQEATIAMLMSELGIGPHVYEVSFPVESKESGEEGGNEVILVMEKFDGNLEQLPDEILDSPAAMAKINKELNTLIEKMHAAGIVHRDLRDANILYKLLPDGSVKLAIGDYGLAFFSADPALLKKDMMDRQPSVRFERSGLACSDWQ